MADTDITKMKVADLKKELKMRGLPTTGNKMDLTERLQAAIVDGDAIIDDTDRSIHSEDILEDEDVLNDDELDDDETKSLLDSSHDDAVLDPIHEEAVLKTPPDSIKSKSPDDSQHAAELQPQKKVILKRKQLISISSEPILTDEIAQSAKLIKLLSTSSSNSGGSMATTTIPDDDGQSGTGGDKKVVKLSELSAKERLEMRAKKFGAPINATALKSARAERFGINQSVGDSTSDPNNKSNEKDGDRVDALKKRAERFGGSVSKIMTKIENIEKLQKRRERFGNGPDAATVVVPSATAAAGTTTVAAATTNITTTTATTSTKTPITFGKTTNIDYEEKARLRLEKFKQSVK